MSASFRPRVVRAGVPSLIPLGFSALLSPGTESDKNVFNIKLYFYYI